MTRWRVIIIVFLFLAPFAFLMGAGSYHLWVTGWTFFAWWPMAASISLAYILLWRWTRANRGLLPETGLPKPPGYWTERDNSAWALVEARAKTVKVPTTEELANPQRYADEAISLATDIARIYNANAQDPLAHLTLPEILTCAELVAHDLNQRVNKYIPGSHLMRIKDWTNARRWINWGQQAYQWSWVARMLYDPVRTSAQFLASRATAGPLQHVQNNVLLWFHVAYIHDLGRFLVELNSGRLKVGTKRYLELMAKKETPPTPVTEHAPGAPAEEKPSEPPPIVIAVLGQVKAGKSSLCNALLGEHQAATDVLPLTAGSTRYQLNIPNEPNLVLVDTAGYGLEGPNDQEFQAALTAAISADLLILVIPARSASRQPDVDVLDRLAKAFASRPHLRVPPVIVAMTHIDLLSPAMEWAPPYDWLEGQGKKEQQIREAANLAREQLGLRVTGIFPVCTAAEKILGIREGLLMGMVEHLDEARGTSLLRTFQAEAEANKHRRVMHQVYNAGREALRILFEQTPRATKAP